MIISLPVFKFQSWQCDQCSGDHVDQRDRGGANHYGLWLSPFSLWGFLSIFWSESSPRIHQAEEGSAVRVTARILLDICYQWSYQVIFFHTVLSSCPAEYNQYKVSGRNETTPVTSLNCLLQCSVPGSQLYLINIISHVIILLIKNLQRTSHDWSLALSVWRWVQRCLVSNSQ